MQARGDLDEELRVYKEQSQVSACSAESWRGLLMGRAGGGATLGGRQDPRRDWWWCEML